MHILPEELNKFQNNSMNTNEMIAFLEHIDHCNYCLEHLLDNENTSAVKAPAYLKEQILTKASAPIVRTDKALHAASYRMRLFYCGLKTAAGVLMALFFLFSIHKVDFASLSPGHTIQQEIPDIFLLTENRPNPISGFSQDISRELSKGSRTLNKYLNDFSKKLIYGGE